MTVIHVDNLTRNFGSFVAVDHISFDVPAGQVFGFLGPNGSGKTTTIKMLLGLLSPTSGDAEILGHNVQHQSNEVRRLIGYMSQKFSLYSDLTVRENLKFFGQSYGLYNKSLRQRMDAVIQMANLGEHLDTLTQQLSGGWAQRLALAAAVIHQPKLLFLDEPTAGVDPISRREFWDLLYDLAQNGTTIFVTTHYMDEAAHAERIAFIYYGRLIAINSPHQIVADTMPGDILVFESPDPMAAEQVIQQAMSTGAFPADSVSLFGAAVHVATSNVEHSQEAIQELLSQQGIAMTNFRTDHPSLEDAFIALVQREARNKRQEATA